MRSSSSLLLCLSVLLCVCAQLFGDGRVVGWGADPEIAMNTTQIVHYQGYPVEEHRVQTSDGFTLTLTRITGTRRGPFSPRKGVAFLQHGLLDSSATWVMNSPEESFAFNLADAGYEVWLGNNRGSTYSPCDKWDFSFDEMGLIDLPTMINYALQVSGAPSLAMYSGHSEGTTQAFIGFSMLPDLAAKVDLFVALAPVAFTGHVEGLLLKLLARTPPFDLYKLFGHGRFFPSTELIRRLFPEICELEPSLCENVICFLCGCDWTYLNRTRFDVYTGHAPAGTSVQNMVHWVQSIRTNKWQAYDYGSAAENMKHYGTPTPREYKLSDVKVKTMLFYGGRDTMGDVTDVQQILSQMPQNLIAQIDYEPLYGHLDFVWGTETHVDVYSKAIAYADRIQVELGRL